MNIGITLGFHGRTEEAVNFYASAVEAEVLFMMRFRDSPDPSTVQPGMEDKIFHATIRVGSTELMATDVGCVGGSDAPDDIGFNGFALALRVESVERAEQFFAALSDEGEVQVPLAETFFASRYGIVIDRFGVSWKIIVES